MQITNKDKPSNFFSKEKKTSILLFLSFLSSFLLEKPVGQTRTVNTKYGEQ